MEELWGGYGALSLTPGRMTSARFARLPCESPGVLVKHRLGFSGPGMAAEFPHF